MIEQLGQAIKTARISKGDKVAEIGCDENIYPALTLATKCAIVCAVDKDYGRIAIYKSQLSIFPYLLRKIHPMVSKAEELPFSKNSIDGIVFYHSFDWIKVFLGNPAKALESTHNSLKLEKYAISIEYSQEDAKEREKMFQDIGFSVERHRNIVLGKKVLEHARDLSSHDEYLGCLEAIERDGQRVREAIGKYGEK